MIDRRTVGCVAISRSAAPSSGARNGRRFSRARVSGRRSSIHSIETSENRMKARKMPRQPASAMMPAPISGAKAGKMVKIIMAIETMRAIWRPA